MVELTYREIDIAAVERAVQSPACGGIVTFVGRVREQSRGRSVQYLEYEAYPEMAVAKMQEIVAAIRERWDTDRVAIVHRLGRLEIGEASVAIAVAAPHRREAFEACRYAIDRLKEEVPIWKKEVTPDGEEWIGQGS
jgi:molybdopterin synthase catalytic subunit